MLVDHEKAILTKTIQNPNQRIHPNRYSVGSNFLHSVNGESPDLKLLNRVQFGRPLSKNCGGGGGGWGIKNVAY